MELEFQNTVSIADVTAIMLGLFGALLGLMNMWKAISDDKVKLVVRPKSAILIGATDSEIDFCIEVLNKSQFPVTVTDVGFLLKGTKSRDAIMPPIMIDGGTFPRRLEPRSSFTVYLKSHTMNPDHQIRCAYAKTDCGCVKTGKSPALKGLKNS